jgi:hypothetical protein
MLMKIYGMMNIVLGDLAEMNTTTMNKSSSAIYDIERFVFCEQEKINPFGNSVVLCKKGFLWVEKVLYLIDQCQKKG